MRPHGGRHVRLIGASRATPWRDSLNEMQAGGRRRNPRAAARVVRRRRILQWPCKKALAAVQSSPRFVRDTRSVRSGTMSALSSNVKSPSADARSPIPPRSVSLSSSSSPVSGA
ncbi:hypothetical protein CO709_13895 [Burkholderia thailandensis]|nr:hypothetical protein CO709_13895 [Burkholderia thailandensis]KST75009.1 hypothetical protein WS76_13155 [Burkholderia humptydooensis]